MSLFVLNIQAYKKRHEYLIHHIDGNHSNNHPNNLMLMTRGAHASLHNTNSSENRSVEENEKISAKISQAGLAYWDEMSLEDYLEWRRIRQKQWDDMSAGSRIMHGESIVEFWKNMDPEVYDQICEERSRLRGGAAIRAIEYLRKHNEAFSIRELTETSGYSQMATTFTFLAKCIEDGHAEQVGTGAYGANLYKSLIYEGE